MKMEPPLWRAASKVYFSFQSDKSWEGLLLNDYGNFSFQFDLLLNYDLVVETFVVLTKAAKL